MGKPIKESWFGSIANTGKQIRVNVVKWADGTTSSNAYIIKQKGSATYVVSNGIKTEIARLSTVPSELKSGECVVLATPFGGSALPCKKITQHRVSVQEPSGVISSFAWSANDAASSGFATLDLA